MRPAVICWRLRRALTAALALATAACRGESPTEPLIPFPYDIVFERRETTGSGTSEAPDLYRLDLGTGETTRILAASVAGMHPSAPRAGSLVAFVRMDNQFTSEIFTATRNASGAFGALTNVSNHSGVDVMPAWSPNGQRIAFVTDRAGFQDIFVVDSDGTNVRRITPADPAGVVTTEWWPAWRPDGQVIAYSSTLEGTADIWTITVDATAFTRTLLTNTADTDLHPTWSPSGDSLAFQRIDQHTGEANIVILDLDTGVERVISMPGQQVWPTWSPEGNLIAFSSNHEDSDFEIYTMRPDGTNVVRRTNDGVHDLRPAWLIRPVQ